MDSLKKHIAVYAAIACLLIIGTFSITYSYFLANLQEEPSITSTKVTVGNLDLNFVTNQYINADNVSLIDDADRKTEAPYTKFVVSHSAESNVPGKYNIYLTDVEISDNFRTTDFKWELVSISGDNETVVNSGNFLSARTGEDFKLTSSDIELPLGTANTYIFRIWLSNNPDENQIGLTNGFFKGKINIIITT